MDPRELSGLPLPALLDAVRSNPGIKDHIPEAQRRLFASRVLSTLVKEQIVDPNLRNILGTKPSDIYFEEVWSYLMKAVGDVSPTKEVVALPPPPGPAVETSTTPSPAPAAPASLGDTTAPRRGRRAAPPPDNPPTAAPDLLMEEVQALSKATSQHAANLANLSSEVAVLLTEVRGLSKDVDAAKEMIKNLVESISLLEEEIIKSCCITMAASEMTGNAAPGEILEAANLPYIRNLLVRRTDQKD